MEDGEEEDDEENNESGEDEDEGEGDSEGEDTDDEDVDIELRKNIEETLRVNGTEAATGDPDSDDNEEYMDDEQMMAIDEQLVEVFRSQANEKKSGKGQFC
jgi:DNA polymerase phi